MIEKNKVSLLKLFQESDSDDEPLENGMVHDPPPLVPDPPPHVPEANNSSQPSAGSNNQGMLKLPKYV